MPRVLLSAASFGDFRDVLHQSVVRLDEFLDALVFQLGSAAAEIDAEAAEIGDGLPGNVEAIRYRVAHRAMIDKGADCFLWHRVDRIRSNQRLDV
jgi:hypothetical protein